MTARAHLIRSALFLLVFLSPVGAPVIGILLSSVCPADTSFEPTGPLAIGFASCGISSPIEQFYQKMVLLPVIPILWMGPVIGLPIAVIWVVTAALSAWMSVKHFVGAIRMRNGEGVGV